MRNGSTNEARATAITLARVLSPAALRALAIANLMRMAGEAISMTELAQAIDECTQLETYEKRALAEARRTEAARYDNA